MRTSGSGLYDDENALVALDELIDGLGAPTEPHSLAPTVALQVWLRGRVSDAVMTEVRRHAPDFAALPARTRPLLAALIADPHAFAKKRSRSAAVTEVLGSRCDGTRYDKLLSGEIGALMVRSLAARALEKLLATMESARDLGDAMHSGGHLGVLLELTTSGKVTVPSEPLERLRRHVERLDEATTQHRDFGDGYVDRLRRAVELLGPKHGGVVPPRRVAVGDLVAVPLGNGFYVAIWIRDLTDGTSMMSEPGCCFVFLEGEWPEVPSEAVLRAAPKRRPLGEALRAQYDEQKGYAQLPLPNDFVIVGTRELAPEDVASGADISGTCMFGTMERVRASALVEWRVVHDGDALRAEWAEAERAREAHARKRREKLTLKRLLRERTFAGCEDHHPEDVVERAREIFREAIEKLIALEKKGTPRQRAAVLKRIVTDFNELDDTTGFVETVERDFIVERIEELARLVGLDNDDEKLTRGRDW